MRVALFNDTGRASHVGCRAVSSGHDRMLAKAGVTLIYRSYYREWHDVVHRLKTRKGLAERALRNRLADIDVVIVNGEGTIHHGKGRHLLAILRMAQGMRRKTYLVNAVLQDVSDGDLKVLRRLSVCTVRDRFSSIYLRRLGIPHKIVFDACIEAAFVKRPPAVDLTDRIVVTDWHGNRNEDVGAACTRLLERLGAEAVYYPLDDEQRANHWDQAVADLRPARVVVTARHHGICLAALAGVPFVALGSNTWKIEGLLKLLPGNLKVYDPGSDLKAACRSAETHTAQAVMIQQWVQAQRPLRTFQALRRAA